jgi:hypothetical protein
MPNLMVSCLFRSEEKWDPRKVGHFPRGLVCPFSKWRGTLWVPDLSPGYGWDSIWNKDKTAPPGAGVLLLFSWYQVQQKDAYQLRLISSYGGYRVCERGSIATPRPMEQHNDERRISTSLPRDMMQSMAGFHISDWSFYLARAALDPPTSLCKKLFRAIDEWHDRLAAKEPSPENNNPIQTTVAINTFVQVILMLRKTLLQDSVLIMDLLPCRPIWQQSIFLIQPTCHPKGKSTSYH